MSDIDSVLKENRSFPPPDNFVSALEIDAGKHKSLMDSAAADNEDFWCQMAREEIDWTKPFSKGLNDSNAPFYTWFEDGMLNVSANCIDRHLAEKGDKIAFLSLLDDGTTNKITFSQMHTLVCTFANGLKKLGVAKGDRVVIYMPMITEAIVAMQACARIGAIHSVVFGGFSARSLYDRIVDAKAKMVITANVSCRGGKNIPLKNTVDESLGIGETTIEHVIVYQRTDDETSMAEGRDIWWHDAIDGVDGDCPPEQMSAEDPLFILYTSGSTGKPKGIQHSSAGYLLGTINTMRKVFDTGENDIFWCTADVGWITGHSFVCYGPMAVGATQLIFEGIPTHPDANRFWQIIEEHKVSIFYTAPTAIRSLIKLGQDLPGKHDLSSLRILGTVGEPINPEAWIWYKDEVGGGRCPIVDTWWQTETGAPMISPIPGVVATKPGSCTIPLPGVAAEVIDESGNAVERGHGGILAITKPWPSMLRTIWNDPDRYRETYFPADIAGGKHYVAGDSAMCDEDGYFWIMGRLDDVLNVSGHRLGTMEIESALVANPDVAEAAVVARPDDLTGEAVVAFVVLIGDRPADPEKTSETTEKLRAWVGKEIGSLAKPAEIRYGDNLPKTRSGKIMRRLLRSIARGEELSQDTSTLENPAILEQLSQKH